MDASIAALPDILAYRCAKAVQVFCRNYRIDEVEAEKVFIEMLKWLWLGRIHQLDQDTDKPENLYIFPSLLVVDEMWHCFILCTRDYSDFCFKFFGAFLHHSPHLDDEESLSGYHVNENISYVISRLGRPTGMLWYLQYRLKYPEDWFRQHRIHLCKT